MSIAAVQKNPWFYVLDEPTRVLVADDDPILLEFATVHLSSPMAAIETAADGATAWAALTSNPFDIALLDIAMPAPDGFSLLEAIRSEPTLSRMPVVMLTGHEDIASIDRAYGLGANSFVTKPVNWRLLSYHIRYVLRTHRIERELRAGGALGDACEAECRSVLGAIAREAASCDGGASAHELKLAMRRIEALATAPLGRASGRPDGAGAPQPAEDVSLCSHAPELVA